MTPIKDLRNILEPFGVRFLDYNLDPWRCEWHDCRMKEKLKVLTSDNVLNIDPPIPSRFYETYKDDPEMKRVDVIFCGYPASLCEMFEPVQQERPHSCIYQVRSLYFFMFFPTANKHLLGILQTCPGSSMYMWRGTNKFVKNVTI